MHDETMGVWRMRSGLCVGMVLVVTAGCGVVVEREIFPRANDAMVEHAGEACELGVVGEKETVVDQDPYCGPGYCVGQGDQPWTVDGQGICTCRCSGPKETGPFCDCMEGFVCKELVKELGALNVDWAGSYCVPRD